MMIQADNKTFIEIGPWVRGISYLEQQDLEEGKNFIKPNNAHLHKRTFLKLPKVTHRHSHQKAVLKMSQQSLDLSHAQKQPISARYGAMNGCLRKGKQPNTSFSMQLGRDESRTIQVALLQRKVSKVQMGDATISEQKPPAKQRRRLVNEQHAKKRGLMQFIQKVALNKDFMQLYIEHKIDPAFSPHPHH